MRGKAKSTRGKKERSRITPAYAGKSSSCTRHSSRSWDHPRVCGEKLKPLLITSVKRGSPPRMRGKAWLCSGTRQRPGITPAYAGKSLWWPPAGGRAQDHPRVCGEKGKLIPFFVDEVGSPPRMRGKARGLARPSSSMGITPAYAGKSWSTTYYTMPVRDHPRVCGEKTKKIPSHRPFQLHPVPVSFSFA